ncbi:putative cysteine-rich protein 1 [Penaeus vannamei]|uniref:Putative cysteine-rich protein 1 n=1 Tax=Penaeus vannamei TaxID=6689 RepID=A0A423T6L9_PENVA|nr:putative cysteine-rich protein 1 [Penaeus vannamei]
MKIAGWALTLGQPGSRVKERERSSSGRKIVIKQLHKPQDRRSQKGDDPRPERKSSLGKDWHAFCLKCEKCNKTLTPGSHAEHEGKPYCTTPCYGALFGPGGYGRGGTQSFVYDKK